MRVKIGPYIDHWSTRSFEDWYMEKRTGKYSWQLEDSDYTWFDNFVVDTLCDFWQGVLNLTINKINSKRKRKVKVRVDEYDYWSADHTLALVILPVLKRLRDEKHGSPFVDDEDVPEELRSTADKDWSEEDMQRDGSTDKFFHERWEYVINEMIWAFEQIVDDNSEDQFHSGNIDLHFEPCKDNPKYSEMVEGPNHTHTFDQEGYEKWSKRIDNGLMLFGKYYRGLWD